MGRDGGWVKMEAPSSMDAEGQPFLLLRSCATTASYPPLVISCHRHIIQDAAKNREQVGYGGRRGRGSGDGEGAASRRAWWWRRRRRHLGMGKETTPAGDFFHHGVMGGG